MCFVNVVTNFVNLEVVGFTTDIDCILLFL